MKLSELKEVIDDLVNLEGEDVLELEVYAACDYGDHCHTQQLIKIGDTQQVVVPAKTAYSATGLALPRDYDDDVKEEEGKGWVVVL